MTSRTDPAAAATAVFRAHAADRDWLDAFSACLDRHRAGQSLARILAAWGLSQAEAARLFGVTRQALAKWLERGPPAERAQALADLAAATDLLAHYLKRERIAAVVRRPAPALGGFSLLELVAGGRTREVLEACRAMFDFERV
ncbi:MAG: hypothetical protein AB7Q81_20360 [Gammaproteobacteria bacterium]